jgi:hypothetical protein
MVQSRRQSAIMFLCSHVVFIDGGFGPDTNSGNWIMGCQAQADELSR